VPNIVSNRDRNRVCFYARSGYAWRVSKQVSHTIDMTPWLAGAGRIGRRPLRMPIGVSLWSTDRRQADDQSGWTCRGASGTGKRWASPSLVRQISPSGRRCGRQN